MNAHVTARRGNYLLNEPNTTLKTTVDIWKNDKMENKDNKMEP